jgi:hypothetical protein
MLNYPAKGGGYNTPQLAAELFPKLALGFIPVIEGLFWGIDYLQQEFGIKMLMPQLPPCS